MFWHVGRPKVIDDIGRQLRHVDSDQVRRVPMAIIDDEPFRYLDILKAHNFNLREYRDIDDIDIVRAYSVVLCDIRGVGSTFGSTLEGAHVIDQIKKRYPETIIVAYTGQQFDPTYNVALRQSDFVMKKDADSDEWVATLEQAIQLVLEIPLMHGREFEIGC